MLNLDITFGPLRLALSLGREKPSAPSQDPPVLQASGGGTQEISDQFPLGFGPNMATERTTRYTKDPP